MDVKALALLLLCACAAAPTTEPASAPPAARPVAPSASVEARGFTGLWNTTWGVMRLQQDGTYVRGSYSYSDGSQIEGDVASGVFSAAYHEPDGTAGRAIFALAPDGRSFHGRWRADPEQPLTLQDAEAEDWDGTRVEAVPGRTWLVILEAPWEQSLAEAEFSYGAMLRSFFTRLPDVEVRHKLFHDRADFVRACREVSQLAGPVVLYISSHGTPEGLQAGGETIDGATIGSALRDAGDLRLLHLGGCGMMRGDMAGDIRAMAAPHARFPISGFTRDVDWAASAIVDIAYMDLVLEQELSPADAVEQARAMLSFAGKGEGDEALPGTDLVILEAE